MSDFYQEVKEWTEGVQGQLGDDAVPPNALFAARDTQLIDIGNGQTKIATRPGTRLVAFIQNELGISVAGRYCHLHNYYHETSSSSFTNYLFLLSEVGEMTYKDQSDNNLPGSSAPPTINYDANDPISDTVFFTKGRTHVDSTNMNNRAFFVNGEGEKRSIKELTPYPFGIPRPSSAASLSISGTVQLPESTYDVRIVTYNEHTGAYSNPSEYFTLTTTGFDRIKIELNLSAAGLTQITHWFVYIRQTVLQANFYQVQILENLAGGILTANGQIPKSTTSAYVNLTQGQIANLIIPSPTENENSEPPTDMLYVATFGRRMIGASKRQIYWSKVDLPDAFPPENTEVVDTGEGDTITGLFPFSDELLLIFTETATFGLFGNDPQDWTLRPIDLTVGSVGHKSVLEFEQRVAWWSPIHGPVTFDGQKISTIGWEGFDQHYLTNPTFTNNKHRIFGGWDPHHSVILWAVPDPENVIFHETGATAPQGIKDVINNLVLPYNYRVGKWCASGWYTHPIDAMAVGLNNRKEPRLFFTNHVKSLFYFDVDVENDLITTFTTSGTFTAGSSSISSITDGSANFGHGNTYGNLLEGCRVTVFTTDGQYVGESLISTLASDTVMNLKKNIAVTSGQTYQYYIASPFFHIATGWLDADQPFLRKRWDRLYLHLRYTDPEIPIYTNIQLRNNSATIHKTFSLTTTGVEATVDATWDANVYTQWPFLKKRLGVWKNGNTMRFTVHQGSPHRIVLDKYAVMGRVLSDRYQN